MERLVAKYEEKLARHGLVEEGGAVIGGLDDDYVWSREDPRRGLMRSVFERLNINSLLMGMPAEPYRSMIRSLVGEARESIRPRDTETRTFFHELPVVKGREPAQISAALERRRCVLLESGEIISFGTVSPEQAFITFSSVIFSCYVKLMTDALDAARRKSLRPKEKQIALHALDMAKRAPAPPPGGLLPGPYPDEDTALAQMAEVGRATVEAGLVDSFFGNISYRLGDTLLISRTGSSLDELEGAVDPCPMDGSSSAGLTASSELTTHMRVVTDTSALAILHGHPRYAVITSLDCREDCDGAHECHVSCPRERSVIGVPIVPGEVGNGPHGLCNTVPNALSRTGVEGVIVYGHGLFTIGDKDLAQALERLHRIETGCRDEYERRLMDAL